LKALDVSSYAQEILFIFSIAIAAKDQNWTVKQSQEASITSTYLK
jgi:hypothetical protein